MRLAKEVGVVQALVNRTRSQQFRVGADGHDPAGVQHHDAVGDFQRVQPVRDDEAWSGLRMNSRRAR